MITVKHPDEACNQSQVELLAQLPPSQRRSMELSFIHGNVVYRYHQRAKDYCPTQQDWQEWLEGLPQNIQAHLQHIGFEEGKTILSFSRYVMEKMTSIWRSMSGKGWGKPIMRNIWPC
jgi:hypothetical protein